MAEAVAINDPRIFEHVTKMGRFGQKGSSQVKSGARLQFRDLPQWPNHVPSPPGSSPTITSVSTEPVDRPVEPVPVPAVVQPTYEEMKLGRNMRAAPRGGVGARTVAARTNPQDLIEMLNRNQQISLTRETMLEEQQGLERRHRLEAELQKYKEQDAQREQERLRRQELLDVQRCLETDKTNLKEDREILELSDVQETQLMKVNGSLEASQRHDDDMRRKDQLLDESFPLARVRAREPAPVAFSTKAEASGSTNTFAATASSPPPVADIFSSEITSPKTLASPEGTGSFRFGGSQIEDQVETTEHSYVRTQMTVEEEIVEEDIEGESDKDTIKEDDFDF